MSLIQTLLVLVGIVASCRGQEFDPYSKGPYSTLQFNINSTTYADLRVRLNVWGPADEGTFPIIFFVGAFDALTPGGAYDYVMQHVASHGYLVAAPWAVALDDPAGKAEVLQHVIDWCKENLSQILLDHGASDLLSVDFENSIAMSHSAGGHILCEYLRSTCGDFKALVLMSPVDGRDPWGIVDNFCTHVGETVNYVLPTIVMAAGLDPYVPDDVGGEFFPACGPEELSNQRFFDSMDDSASKWLLNATEYGHADFMDFGYEEIVDFTNLCAVNENANLIDFNHYRSFIGGQIVSFTKGVFSEDCSPYLPFLEDPSLMLPVVVTAEGGAEEGGCPKPGCTWSQP